MEYTLKLVSLQWISEEREKYIWEDLYGRSWDEIIGRMYLLKAHHVMERMGYEAALADFEQATCLLHLKRYKKAIATYEAVIAEGLRLGDEGLEAARLGQQPDWDKL